jgi:uncharacterized OB-fold protein
MTTEPAKKQGRLLPKPTPETQHFWEGAKHGELRLQRCCACETTYFPPQPFCPSCTSGDVEVIVASGRGTLHSYVISHKPTPGIAPPYCVAVVELAEGPRMMSNIIGTDITPENLPLDMPVRVQFVEQNDEIALPFFQPEDLI